MCAVHQPECPQPYRYIRRSRYGATGGRRGDSNCMGGGGGGDHTSAVRVLLGPCGVFGLLPASGATLTFTSSRSILVVLMNTSWPKVPFRASALKPFVVSRTVILKSSDLPGGTRQRGSGRDRDRGAKNDIRIAMTTQTAHERLHGGHEVSVPLCSLSVRDGDI